MFLFYARRDEPARCPNCGERVTPNAAGCWLCGAALDPARWQRAPGWLDRALAWWRRATAARRR
jgi:predicted amidophosphoribosyltransferase